MLCGATSRLTCGVLIPCARKSAVGPSTLQLHYCICRVGQSQFYPFSVQTLRSCSQSPAARISVKSTYTSVLQVSRGVRAMSTRVDIAKIAFEPETLASVAVAESAKDWKGDVKALGVFEDAFEVKDGTVTFLSEELKAVNESSGSIISEMLTSGDFKGAKGSPARFFTLVGLGKSKTLSEPKRGASAFQAAGGAVTAACKSCKGKTAIFSWIAPLGDASVDAAAAAQDVAYGALTSTPEGTRFKSDPGPPPTLQSVSIVLPEGSDAAAATAAITRGVSLAKGNLYARWLVDAPPNVCNPTYLANSAKAIAEKFPDVMSCTVLDKAACEEMKMGCYLGVASCSTHPPQFIHLTYKPSGEVKKKVAIVGKGLTFDSGGYNIKAGAGSMIEVMKLDMGGAAAIFGAARAIAELKPAGIEVHFISAACENLIDGQGMLPGDILVSANGKTVEIGNTDAEGRLTLCDALWYAQEKVGASHCVDIATLTGAQIIALGGSIGAVMSPVDTAAARVITAGTSTGGEKWWQLPLEDEYFESMKSKVADFNNVGGRAAGSITAGLFLKQFVDGEKMEWAHLDIAGPSFDQAAKLGTGFGATTLTHWVEALATEET